MDINWTVYKNCLYSFIRKRIINLSDIDTWSVYNALLFAGAEQTYNRRYMLIRDDDISIDWDNTWSLVLKNILKRLQYMKGLDYKSLNLNKLKLERQIFIKMSINGARALDIKYYLDYNELFMERKIAFLASYLTDNLFEELLNFYSAQIDVIENSDNIETESESEIAIENEIESESEIETDEIESDEALDYEPFSVSDQLEFYNQSENRDNTDNLDFYNTDNTDNTDNIDDLDNPEIQNNQGLNYNKNPIQNYNNPVQNNQGLNYNKKSVVQRANWKDVENKVAVLIGWRYIGENVFFDVKLKNGTLLEIPGEPPFEWNRYELKDK